MASEFTDWVDVAAEQENKLAGQMETFSITVENNDSSSSPGGAKLPRPTNTTTSYNQNNQKAERKISSCIDDQGLSPKGKFSIQRLLQTKLVPSSKEFEILQRDPTTPLLSVTSFEELPLRAELKKGVYAMGFNGPSRIQEYALPMLLSEPPQNLIAQSRSETGKTAAIVLAILSRVDPSIPYPQVLYLSPRYELAVQTGKVIEQMGKFCPEIKVRYAIRHETVSLGTKLTEHIILGTPAKVADWALRTRCFDLGKVKVFAIDEADALIATQGNHDQSIKIHRSLSRDCQKMLFSTTYDRDVMKFSEKMIPDATVIKLKREEERLNNIRQYYIECKTTEEKYQAVATICGLNTVGSTIVFCQMRKTATWLTSKLIQDGYSVAHLHGDFGVAERIHIFNRFRDGHDKILITTNLMARVNVGQVTLVVNYDLPTDVNGQPDCETYLDRIERTRRFRKVRMAINLADDSKSMQILNTIRDHFGLPMEKLNIDDVKELEQLEN